MLQLFLYLKHYLSPTHTLTHTHTYFQDCLSLTVIWSIFFQLGADTEEGHRVLALCPLQLTLAWELMQHWCLEVCVTHHVLLYHEWLKEVKHFGNNTQFASILRQLSWKRSLGEGRVSGAWFKDGSYMTHMTCSLETSYCRFTHKCIFIAQLWIAVACCNDIRLSH